MPNGQSQVDVEMLSTAADVNEIYQEAITNLKERKKRIEKPTASTNSAEKEQAAKDYYANVCFFLLPIVMF